MSARSVRPLPESTPAAKGVDARGVGAFLDALEAAPGLEPHSLMIVRHGHVVASGWWAPYTADRPHLLYSISKSFTSTAAGFAVAEGLMSLDDPVISYFPEFDGDITDPRSRAMLVRHVAAMSSGHLTDAREQAFTRDPAEPVRGFLLTPPDRDPGTVFAYNNAATYSLAAIVQRVTGQSLTDYLRPRLFDPLGIGETAWIQRPPGRDLGFSGMYATTDALARLGLLYLGDGVWEGRRLLPAAWVAEATRAQISNADGTAAGAVSDWQQGYGFQFWRSRHGYRGDGAYGQFCLVLPEHDAVVAMTTDTENMQAVLDKVWRHLLPAFGPAPLDHRQDDDAALRRRLDALELPTSHEKFTSPGTGSGATTFTPAGGTCADQSRLTEVTVAAGGDGVWTVSLAEGASRLDVRLGAPGWTVEEGADGRVPTAASGGWTDPDTFVADIAFLETPHHFEVTCSRADRTFTARWRTMPLHRSPLTAMGVPRRTVG
ncbi:serine hydrolase [Streptomyces sp. NBRC 110028]|uniref:serine hydrolase domain-containing protein n=1 Tax=Streptomyces sp. NBRC 110028 TaxID=1621260 RepID=UPI0006E41ECD|nr:serine hydrolase domain-containing protein [Streptomyces sp. NBRC 110028]